MGYRTEYEYDALNRLTAVEDALDQCTDGYDKLGRMVSQTDALNRTTRFEFDKVGQRTGRILPLVQRYSYTYDAYGNLLNSSGSSTNNYRFTGEQFDPNTGDYYLRDRYYGTDIGRFTRSDVFEGNINDPLSLNKYLYTHSNPVNAIDPSGKFSLVELNAAESLRLELTKLYFNEGLGLASRIARINGRDDIANEVDNIVNQFNTLNDGINILRSLKFRGVNLSNLGVIYNEAGGLIPVGVNDPGAALLASKIGGQKNVRFASDTQFLRGEFQISNDSFQSRNKLMFPLTLNLAKSPIVISTISLLFDTTLLFRLKRANQWRLSELFRSIFFVSFFVTT